MCCPPTFGEASLGVKAGAVKRSVCYAPPDMAEPFLEVAVDAARRAGALLLDRFGSLRQVRYKGSPSNLVTEMDRQAEALVIDLLHSRFPDHAILAEEGGARPGSSTHRWIVDPLDGTTNYAHGMPFFAVSIALEIEGAVQLGVVFDPNRDECFTVVRGEGAFLNDQPLRVSHTPTLDESLLSTGYPYDIRRTRENNLAEHAAFMVRCRSVREMGSAAINLALVATGRLDGFWELVLGPWDVAAGCLMVEEAGGRVTNPAGGPVDLGRPSVVASNGRIHDEMLATLREVRAQAPRG
jgi:myo-inositol-1(or 4)-monophosphatase